MEELPEGVCEEMMNLTEAIAELKAEKELNNEHLIEILTLLEKAFLRCDFNIQRSIGANHIRYHYNIRITKFLKKYRLFGEMTEVPIATISFGVFTTGGRPTIPLPLNIEVTIAHRSAVSMIKTWELYLKVKERYLKNQGINNKFHVDKIFLYKNALSWNPT